MGKVSIAVEVRRNRKSGKVATFDFLLDSGMHFAVVPGPALRRLGVEPEKKESLSLPNGEIVSREVGEAYFEFEGKGGMSRVIFGEEGDCTIIGDVTLATLQLVFDPLKRELKPLPLLLMKTG